jgi:D-alanyl-D-alanine carboxypeptidase (penicillin-binding protein 5/6)
MAMLRLPLILLCLGVGSVLAQGVPAPPAVAAKGYLLIDHHSGVVLAEGQADQPFDPASLTKLMTAYVVFGALADGRIALDDAVLVSEKAWRMRGSRMFIEVNTEVAVSELIRGMIIQSGNDASVALAEHISGSVEAFIETMNDTALRLGMTGTAFRNVTGLPSRGHVSTARDLAALARAIINEYPEHYFLYSEREYTFNDIRQYNRNALLRLDPSVDGMKTGYTSRAGYCLVSSAERDGMRLIAVVLGMDTAGERTKGSQALLDYGFSAYETHRLFGYGDPVAQARVLHGEPDTVALGASRDIYVTIPRGRYDYLRATLNLAGELVAPLAHDAPLGELTLEIEDQWLDSVPMFSLHAVQEAGFIGRISGGIDRLFD